MTAIDRLAKMLASMERRLRVLERAPQLGNSSFEGTIREYDDDGQSRVMLGLMPDGSHGLAAYNDGEWVQFPRDTSHDREAIFSTSTAPEVDAESGPYGVDGTAIVRRFRVFLSPAGSSDTTVSLRRNGVEFVAVTVASGATSGSDAAAEGLVDGDVLTVAATEVGTDVGAVTAIAYLVA